MPTSPPGASERALGLALRRLRLARGLGLRAVGAAANVPPSALGAYERGERIVPAARLAQLCDFYGVAVTSLIYAQRPAEASANCGSAVRFDFEGLANAKSPEARATVKVVQAIRQRRSTVRPSDGSIVLRRDDLLVVAAALGLTLEGLVHRLRREGILRRPTGRRSVREG